MEKGFLKYMMAVQLFLQKFLEIYIHFIHFPL